MSILDSFRPRRPHGTGWRKQPVDDRDISFGRLGLASSNLPEEKSLWPHVKSVRDQGRTSSCVGQGVAAAVTIAEHVAGFPWELASALFPYWYARYIEGNTRADNGTYIRHAVQAMDKLGIPDARYWPDSTSYLTIIRQPSVEAYMHAHPRAGGIYTSIKDVGSAKSDAVRAAIAGDHPVIFGAYIDDPFCHDSGPTIIDKPTVPRYGHCMVVIGYRVDPDFGLAFEILNSWGAGWRAGGRAWITDAYLRSWNVADLTVVHGWNRIREAYHALV